MSDKIVVLTSKEPEFDDYGIEISWPDVLSLEKFQDRGTYVLFNSGIDTVFNIPFEVVRKEYRKWLYS